MKEHADPAVLQAARINDRVKLFRKKNGNQRDRFVFARISHTIFSEVWQDVA